MQCFEVLGNTCDGRNREISPPPVQVLHAEILECHFDIFFGAGAVSAIIHGNLKYTFDALVDLEPLEDRDCLGSLFSNSTCKGWDVDIFQYSFEFNIAAVMWEIFKIFEVTAYGIEERR
jgi:hypothetical protein